MIISGEALERSIKDRIKIAAPLTMLMMTTILERGFLREAIDVLSLHWFLITIGFFVITTALFSVSVYTYKYLNHKCKACGESWMRLRTDDISISSNVMKFSLIQWYIFIRSEKIVKTYKCKNCSHIEHKKTKRWSFVGIRSTG
jgi:hypothetical protein